jgi:hypothetical protein
MNCYTPSCSFTHLTLDRLVDHIQTEHNNNMKVSVDAIPFPAVVATATASPSHLQDNGESSEQNDAANLASGEESTTDASSSISLGPVRGRQPHLTIRPTPYQRTDEDSSRSVSPIQRPSLRTLSPLQISLALSAPSGPSPLQKLAFSRANSPSPRSDHEMDVDEAGSPMNEDEPSLDKVKLPFNEEEVFAKASFAIVPLSYLQTTPPARLLVCTKCQHGILTSSLLTHSKSHNIKLLPAEKQNLQDVMKNSTFLDDSTEIPTPNPPCPPIEGIKVQGGYACNLCSYCCTAVQTMRNHFNDKHKGALGFPKDNCKQVQVQAFFARRPNYFAVTPSLRGLNKDDLFTKYLQQCAPEIEALTILNPPLNANEVPPLLKVTQWHEHLKGYTNTREQVQKLQKLTKLPTSKKGEAWMGFPLRATIDGYMRGVRDKAHNASLGIRCLLIECPRFIVLLYLALLRC